MIKAVIKSKKYQEESDYRGESRSPKIISHVKILFPLSALEDLTLLRKLSSFLKFREGKC